MSRATYRDPPSRTAHRRKSMLFCPTCGHQSPARRGDWVVEHRLTDDGRRVELSCPTCETTLTVEPSYHE
ncbi:hypothetical protein [Halomarina oriensis]|uniref:DUF8106 domain-containing protein n=1 Tax=Halomarina oriensis TaxID=671145 RepID=A0A6B0GTW2_9EURY|nr:hypothetical protein [Halomarina oriensis]MWG36053.1 hypothetical protein [Halomarina oriensis]